MRACLTCLGLACLALAWGCSSGAEYDVLIRNGMIYDGTGIAPFAGNVAINGDTLVAVGPLDRARGRTEIDATGLAIAPGFIRLS